MSDKSSLQKDVEQRFREFLLAHELRQTRERFAILEAIYSIEGTFTIEHLQELMQERRFPVSTGTLYSTLQLLIQANLLIRHPFNFSSVFERIADSHPRSYQICNNCHRITRIKSKELASSLETYHPRGFSISHRIVYIYGTCPGCLRKMRKMLKLKEQNKL